MLSELLGGWEGSGINSAYRTTVGERFIQKQCWSPLVSLNAQGNTSGMFRDGFPTGVCHGKAIFCLAWNHIQIDTYSLWCEILIIIVTLHPHSEFQPQKAADFYFSQHSRQDLSNSLYIIYGSWMNGQKRETELKVLPWVVWERVFLPFL